MNSTSSPSISTITAGGQFFSLPVYSSVKQSSSDVDAMATAGQLRPIRLSYQQLPLTSAALQSLQTMPPMSLAERLACLIKQDVYCDTYSTAQQRTTSAGLAPAVAKAQFFIFSAAGPVLVCEQRTHRTPNIGLDLTYLLLRLCPLSSQLPKDACLLVTFARPRCENHLQVRLVRVCLEDGIAHHDLAPEVLTAHKIAGSALASYTCPLSSIIFSPKVGGDTAGYNPHMYVLFLASEPCCGLPMFTEASAVCTGVDQRNRHTYDPVEKFSDQVLNTFFHPGTITAVCQHYKTLISSAADTKEVSGHQRREFEEGARSRRAMDRLNRLSCC